MPDGKKDIQTHPKINTLMIRRPRQRLQIAVPLSFMPGRMHYLGRSADHLTAVRVQFVHRWAVTAKATEYRNSANPDTLCQRHVRKGVTRDPGMCPERRTGEYRYCRTKTKPRPGLQAGPLPQPNVRSEILCRLKQAYGQKVHLMDFFRSWPANEPFRHFTARTGSWETGRRLHRRVVPRR
jgi:hypothetical protein